MKIRPLFGSVVLTLCIAAATIATPSFSKDNTKEIGFGDVSAALKVIGEVQTQIEKLRALTLRQEKCHEAIRLMISGGNANAAKMDCAEKGSTGESLDVETSLSTIFQLNKDIRAQLLQLDGLGKGELPKVDTTTLRIINVRAGDLGSSANSCGGEFAIQSIMMACFAVTTGQSANAVTDLSETPRTSCASKAALTVKGVCGYEPTQDQGPRSLRITYRCGDDNTTRTYEQKAIGKIAFGCGDKLFRVH